MTNHGEGENRHFHRFHGYDYSRGAIVGFRAWIVALIVIFVWGVTFANTRALLADFSALEILVVRFAFAWAALWAWGGRRAACAARPPYRRVWRDEGLFAAMGFCGIFCYQFLENCAIYYTNASNVAIFVSFGPIVTAALARMFTKDRSLSSGFSPRPPVLRCGITPAGESASSVRASDSISRRSWASSSPLRFSASARPLCR